MIDSQLQQRSGGIHFVICDDLYLKNPLPLKPWAYSRWHQDHLLATRCRMCVSMCTLTRCCMHVAWSYRSKVTLRASCWKQRVYMIYFVRTERVLLSWLNGTSLSIVLLQVYECIIRAIYIKYKPPNTQVPRLFKQRCTRLHVSAYSISTLGIYTSIQFHVDMTKHWITLTQHMAPSCVSPDIYAANWSATYWYKEHHTWLRRSIMMAFSSSLWGIQSLGGRRKSCR